ncbi:hypothetical protein D3C86_1839060 [compost metagenome]
MSIVSLVIAPHIAFKGESHVSMMNSNKHKCTMAQGSTCHSSEGTTRSVAMKACCSKK